MIKLKDDDAVWAEKLYRKCAAKFAAECRRLGTSIPYIAENGRYDDCSGERIDWWTNGFWPGILWLMYHAAGDKMFRDTAEGVEEKLAVNLREFRGNDHDYGFRYQLSFVADYKLTGDEKARRRGLWAAQLLAGRFNPDGGFIRAWDMPERVTWMIIDCMMNLPLLYWASEETKDPRFAAVAVRHGKTSLEALLRKDGSCSHVAVFDPDTWKAVSFPAGQGYAQGSSWSRGQAWAVYGFALSYRHTKDTAFLEGARRAAHYFLVEVCTTGFLPRQDFRAPREVVMYDTTAGMAAACGLLLIAESVTEAERAIYVDGALQLLKAAEREVCDFDPERDSILQMGTVMYTKQIHVPIIYGDFFLLEAVLKLTGRDFAIW